MIYLPNLGTKEGQNKENLRDKAARIINFKPKSYPVAELYKSSRILKLSDYIKLLNQMFVRETLTATQIPAFKNYLKKLEKSIDTIPDTLLKTQ